MMPAMMSRASTARMIFVLFFMMIYRFVVEFRN
jgi:hypothetical protein